MSDQLEPEATLYWQVLGRLHPDNRLVLKPGYLTSRVPRRRSKAGSDLNVELLDDDGAVLGRFPLQLTEYCDDGGQPVPELGVQGWVPFHPATRTAQFLRGGLNLLTIRRADNPPDVTLEWTPSDQVKGEHVVTWSAARPEDLPLQFFLRYSHTGGETWQRLTFRTEDDEITINFDDLPGGKECRIALVATDGINTTIVESDPFAVDVKPCQAIILSPQEDERFSAGEPVALRGQGFYLEENESETRALTWTSDRDGELGRGTFVEAVKLSSGPHEITLQAGEGDRQGSDSVRIHVDGESREAAP